MKKWIALFGANGVGKSTVARELNHALPHSISIDAEYAAAYRPFGYTDETIPLIRDNLYALLSNAMRHDCVEYILFPFGLHGARADLYQGLFQSLSNEYLFEYHPFILTCMRVENIARMEKDGRDGPRIERALIYSRIYDAMSHPRIDTTGLSAAEVARIVMGQI